MAGRVDDRIYVALDLETTGLNPLEDDIIEVAAVRFQGDKQLDSFHSLANPFRPVPFRIKMLCNISQEEVNAAPPFTDLKEGLISFLGEDPLVGHNPYFDLD